MESNNIRVAAVVHDLEFADNELPDILLSFHMDDLPMFQWWIGFDL